MIHSEAMQFHSHVILSVEPLWWSWGTGQNQSYSHYEEDDLRGSKRKNSSEWCVVHNTEDSIVLTFRVWNQATGLWAAGGASRGVWA